MGDYSVSRQWDEVGAEEVTAGGAVDWREGHLPNSRAAYGERKRRRKREEEDDDESDDDFPYVEEEQPFVEEGRHYSLVGPTYWRVKPQRYHMEAPAASDSWEMNRTVRKERFAGSA